MIVLSDRSRANVAHFDTSFLWRYVAAALSLNSSIIEEPQTDPLSCCDCIQSTFVHMYVAACSISGCVFCYIDFLSSLLVAQTPCGDDSCGNCIGTAVLSWHMWRQIYIYASGPFAVRVTALQVFHAMALGRTYIYVALSAVASRKTMETYLNHCK